MRLSRRNWLQWLIIAAIGLSLCSCGVTSEPAATSTLTVSAAASLKDVLTQLVAQYQQKQPQTQVLVNFGSSGALQQQIEQGAPVDIFIAAAEKQMNALEQQNLLLPGTRQQLVQNQLVLIAPKPNQELTSLADLTRAATKLIAIGNPESVPAGQYAQQALTALKLYDRLKPKLVFTKDVRQVLTYVETNNVDAGFVYLTDAKVSKAVRVVETAPAGTHQPIVYPVAVLQRTPNPEAARDFVQFLLGEPAQQQFQQAGFSSAVLSRSP